MQEDSQLQLIVELMDEIYGYKLKEIDQDLLKYLKNVGYDVNCKTDNLECENCISAWLYLKKRNMLYEKNRPFESYISRIKFYQENSEYFDLETRYRMDDGFLLSVQPKNIEEAKIFTPIIDQYNQNERIKEKLSGRNNFFKFPFYLYDELVEEFFRKFNQSPVPEKFLTNERERIEEIVTNEGGLFEKSFKKEKNAIINCEQKIFDFENPSDSIIDFWLRSRTYPIAKYEIFLDTFDPSEKLGKNLDNDDLQIVSHYKTVDVKILNKTRSFVANDKLDKAITEVRENIKPENVLIINQLDLFENQLVRFNKEKAMGFNPNEGIYNKIVFNFLKMLNEIESINSL